MNPDLDLLQPYPFEKLAQLKAGLTPPAGLHHIALSIGEPKHAPPALVLDALAAALPSLASYPATKGMPELREAIARWAMRRFRLPEGLLDPEDQILPVSGTREALFAFAQACVAASGSSKVVMPNPFYQIYEGAALLAGAEPYFLNCTRQNDYIPDFTAVPEAVWRECSLLYLCSPGNPTGRVLPSEVWQQVIELADRHDFIIASDECYSELYPDEAKPPVGLLQVCAELGRNDFSRCVVFHSLSKRSNLPGLRSGFVAGDANILAQFLRYRTYHGCALPVPTQMASISAWQDEEHVKENRSLYREKFTAVGAILADALDFELPEAGFYLWPRTPIDDQVFTQRLFAEQNVTVVPGQFLAREAPGGNPGRNHVRMALVASLDECVEAANRVRQFVGTLQQ